MFEVSCGLVEPDQWALVDSSLPASAWTSEISVELDNRPLTDFGGDFPIT